MPSESTGELPSSASVVVIGGGAMGCSTLYHLAKAGMTDAILLERNQLTSGTTWHSAAQVRALRSSRNLTNLIRHSIDLYQSLEAETGQSTGWINRGSLSIATTPDRLIHIRRQKGLADLYGLEATEVSREDAASLWPMMNASDVLSAIWSPEDGRVSPSDLCLALTKGAKALGARWFEETAVEAILTRSNRITGVVANGTTIKCDAIALCSGLWSRENSILAGDTVPVWPCHHYYLLTRPVAGFDTNLPTLSDHDSSLYLRDDSGGILVGCFESHAKAMSVDDIGHSSPFKLLPEDWDHFEPVMEAALHRLPALADAEVRTLLNGPESFTPDGNFLLGESATTDGLYLGCGMNSVGLASAGGAGWALSRAIVDGNMPCDLGELDPKRFHPCYSNIEVLSERVPEILGKHYEISYPGRQWQTARNLRTLPLDAQWREHRAVMGEVAGWERPLYFNPEQPPSDKPLSFGQPSWFEQVGNEVRECTQNACLFELSTFGRFRIAGPGAEGFMKYLCTNTIAVADGRVIYTLLLNLTGGIEFDAVVLRRNSSDFLLSIGSAHVQRAASWLRRRSDEFSRKSGTAETAATTAKTAELVLIENLSETTGALSITGPQSENILKQVCPDFAAPRFFRHTEKLIGSAKATVANLSYVGEAGFELFFASEDAQYIFKLLTGQGAKPAGLYAQTSMRIEKGFAAYGHELDIDVSPAQVGLCSFVDFDQPFYGLQALRKAAEKQHEKSQDSRVVYILAEESDLILLGNEPLIFNDQIIGKTTSAAFGYRLQSQVAIAQLNDDLSELAGETFTDQAGRVAKTLAVQVNVAGNNVSATLCTQPFFQTSA